MSKRSSFLVILIILGISLGIYFSQKTKETTISSKQNGVTPKLKKKKQIILASSIKKMKNSSSNAHVSETDSAIQMNKNIELLITDVKNDIVECRNNMNELFGAEDVDINFKLYTDFEILDSFKKLNKINFNSKKTGALLEYIANDVNQISKKEMDKLEVIAPCRVFQKINFLDEVKRRLTQSQNSILKQELKTELRGFFVKEVSTSSSVASLTMALNMIESFSDPTGLRFSKNEQEKIDQIIDDMEGDYEKMLISVEDDLSADLNNDNQELSRTLIRSEIELNKKYKNRILDLLK